MNKEWSDLNKALQSRFKCENTFASGLNTLFELRRQLMDELDRMKRELNREDFNAMPFPDVNGYHRKTIAYSIWHVFRIEDIVAHSLILHKQDVFCKFKDIIGAPIITTGNELTGREIVDFSKQIDLDALYDYAAAEKESTEAMLKELKFYDLRRKFDDEDKDSLRALCVVSDSEESSWLIDYWCGKDIRGLIQMPFSRHWIMHIEACLRIEAKLLNMRAKAQSSIK